MKLLTQPKPIYAYLALIALIFLLPCPASGMSLYRVGDVVIGESYNDLMKRWVERDFSIWVGVETSGDEELVFKADTGLGYAHVSTPHTQETVELLERLLVTANEWSSVAKRNRADTSKALGCFSNHKDEICEKFGAPNHQNQMGLRFWSGNEGQEARLVIELIDQSNKFKHATIHLDSPQIAALLKHLRQMPATIKKAKAASAKQDLFTIPGQP